MTAPLHSFIAYPSHPLTLPCAPDVTTSVICGAAGMAKASPVNVGLAEVMQKLLSSCRMEEHAQVGVLCRCLYI